MSKSSAPSGAGRGPQVAHLFPSGMPSGGGKVTNELVRRLDAAPGIAVIERALARHRPDPADPLGLLAAIGGFEIAGLVGLILAAAAARLPVVIDGLITGAAALVAVALCPAARVYLIAAHCSAEPGHRRQLEALGLKPVLELGLRLGEGTGAVLSFPILRAAAGVLAGMATFEEAGVGPAVEGS